MILDLHVHSVASDDAAPSLEAYLKWLRVLRKRHRIDGLVLTDHRAHRHEADFQRLSEEFDVIILSGYEVETDCGHLLLYGVDEIANHFDFDDIHLNALELVRAVKASGGIAVPSHPGRPFIGLCDHTDRSELLEEIDVIERLNGASRPDENERAGRLAAERGFFGIGGSDAHYVSSVGTCLTQFERPIATIEDLVAELYAGRCRALYREDAPLV